METANITGKWAFRRKDGGTFLAIRYETKEWKAVRGRNFTAKELAAYWNREKDDSKPYVFGTEERYRIAEGGKNLSVGDMKKLILKACSSPCVPRDYPKIGIQVGDGDERRLEDFLSDPATSTNDSEIYVNCFGLKTR